MGGISSKLKSRIQETKRQKIIDIETLYAANEKSTEDLRNVKLPEEMGADIDPAHAVYASVQNLFSVIVENLSMLKLFDEYAGKIEKAMDTYQPGFPPMSPVTDTFFSFWAHFDFRLGIDKEMMGTGAFTSRKSSLNNLLCVIPDPDIWARMAKSGLSELCRHLSI